MEMLDIAAAIVARRDERAKRCAVEFRDGAAYLYSPRNTNEAPVPVSMESADDLAVMIRKMIPGGE